MDRRTDMWLLASFIATVAILALALGVSADPADLNQAPTEDWVFDSGGVVTIADKDWDVNYNITVTNGTTLKIQDCEWMMEGIGGERPVWIQTDEGSRMEIFQCTFDGTGGATGFFIIAREDISISNTKLLGMTGNSGDRGALSINKCSAELIYVEMDHTDAFYGIYTFNSDINISNSVFNDTTGTIGYFYVNSDVVDATFNVTILETEFVGAGGDGLHLASYYNNGVVTFDLYDVEIHDIALIGIFHEDGEKTYGQGSPMGYGSVLCTLEQVEIYDIGDQGLALLSDNKASGPSHLGFYNITMIDCHVHDIVNTGIYWIRYYSIVKTNLVIEGCVFEDIAMEPTWNRLSAVFAWRYGSVSGGYDLLYMGNTTFRRCNPGGLWFWDHGQGTYGVGGIPRYFHIYNCVFTECTQAAILRVMDEGGQTGYFIVENCSFYDNLGHGILIDNAVRPDLSSVYGMTLPHSKMDVWNTTFINHGKSTLAVTSNCVDQVQEIGYFLKNCLIDHSDGFAVEIRPNNPKGVIYLHMNETRINDTMGVFLFYDNEVATTAGFDVRIHNCSIENSTLTALYVRAQGPQAPEAKVLIEDTVIRMSGRDGISVHVGPVGTAQQVSGFVQVHRVTIEEVDGVGIRVTNDRRDVLGTRFFYINDTTIWTAQQGVVVMGFPGEMWNTVVKDILLEDMRVTYTTVNVWYCEFTTIDDQKFKVESGGEIYHYYVLSVRVLWDTGKPAIGATVEIMDNTESLLTVQTVNQPDGSLPSMTMNSYIIRGTGIYSNSPYRVSAVSAQVSKWTAVKLDGSKSVVLVMKDRILPEIYIHYPRAGHAQQSTLLQVRGTAWDYQSGIDRVEVSLDGVTWEVATGRSSWNYTMEVSQELILSTDGRFNLRARAIDHAGNERTAFALIYIDPTPPKLLVDFPYDGYVTNDPSCIVRGVTELDSSVKVNGVDVPVLVSLFTHEITLVEGPNTLTVIAVDPMGNIQVVRVKVTLDTQTPYLQLIAPEEGATTNNATLWVTAQLEADLLVTINGQLVPYGSPEYPLEGGTLEYPLSLVSGDNRITIRAMDAAGNVVTLERVVGLDIDPPWVLVANPRQGLVMAHPEVTVIGTAEATALLFINDEAVTLLNGYFERTILCLEGDNEIVIRAFDPAGNMFEETVTVTVDTEPPYIELTSPRPLSTSVNTPVILVQGTVMHEGVVTTDSVSVNGVAYPLSDAANGRFSVPLELVEGVNEVLVEVMDGVGNLASVTRTVVLDTDAPNLVMVVTPATWKRGAMTSPANTVRVTGYTEPGAVLLVNDVLLSLGDDGSFSMLYPLNSKGGTTIIARSTDVANNTMSLEQVITYSPVEEQEEEETDNGMSLLIGSIVLLVVVTIIAVLLVVRQRREPPVMDERMLADLEPIIEPEEEGSPDEEERMKAASAAASPPTRVRPRPVVRSSTTPNIRTAKPMPTIRKTNQEGR